MYLYFNSFQKSCGPGNDTLAKDALCFRQDVPRFNTMFLQCLSKCCLIVVGIVIKTRDNKDWIFCNVPVYSKKNNSSLFHNREEPQF